MLGVFAPNAKATDDTLPSPLTYYVTDSYDTTYYNNFLQSITPIGAYSIYSYPGQVDFWNWFDTVMENLSNSGSGAMFPICEEDDPGFIIFELTYGLPVQKASEIKNTDLLKTFFQTLKNRNYKVMFICDTDERSFKLDNQFLDFVDIHINTDRYTDFALNIFYEIKAWSDNAQLEHCTFLFDNMSGGSESRIGNSNSENIYFGTFLKWRLIPFIRSEYFTEASNGDTDADIMDAHDIRILCHVAGDQYYDLLSDSIVVYDEEEYSNDLYDENGNERYICAIGNAGNVQVTTENWLNSLYAIKEQVGLGDQRDTFSIYLFIYLIDTITSM